VGYNFVTDNMGLSSFLWPFLPPKSAKSLEISSSKSSKVINYSANRKRIRSFLLVINSNLGHVSYRVRDIEAYTSLVWRPRSWKSLEFLNETYPAKTTATVRWKLHNPNFNRFYRAMHFSAKRSLAIACRLSVCLSVCLWCWWTAIT